MDAPLCELPPFQAPYTAADEELAGTFFAQATRDSAAEQRIDARARRLVEAIRAKATGLGGIEDFLHAYSLSTKEGLALMVLAEALLRVPDAATADRLIEDKLGPADWLISESNPMLCSSRLRAGRSASARASSIRGRRRKASSTGRRAASACRRCERRSARRCGYGLAFRLRRDDRRSPARVLRPRRLAIPSICSAKARARPRTRNAILHAYAGAIAAIGARGGRRRCQPPGNFRQTFGAEPALRASVSRSRARRTRPASSTSH